MKVTQLPDVPPGSGPARGRHRHLRRRPPRPPRGDPRQRHGAHLRPAPAGRDPPRGDAQADRLARRQARPDRGAGRRRAGRDPVRPRASPRRPPRSSSSDVLIDRLGATAGLGRRELPLRQGGRGRPRTACARTTSSRRAWCRSSRWRGRRCRRATSAGWSPPARSRQAAEFLGGPFLFEGEVVDRRPARARARHARPPTSSPTTRSSAPGHGVYAAWAHGLPGGRERRRAAHLRDRPRPAGGGPPDRLRRRPLRPDAADRVPRADARREALRLGRTRWSSRCSATSPRRRRRHRANAAATVSGR